jgi:hypothetical protein
MTGTTCVQTSHSLSRSYLNHLVRKRNTEARSRNIVAVEKQQVLHIGLCVHSSACVHVGTRVRWRVHAHTCM